MNERPRERAWIADQVGAELKGRLVRYEQRTDRKGRDQRIAIIENDSGTLHAVWCFKHGVGYVVDQAKPRVGDHIHLARVEDRVLDDGRVFPRFRIDVTRAKPTRPAAPRRERVEWDRESPF